VKVRSLRLTRLGCRGLAIPCVLIAAAWAVSSAYGSAVARLARLVSLNESAHLHLTSKKGFTLNEQGTATGTITGTIYIHLHIVSNSKVTEELSIFPSGGSLAGSGSASYHVDGGNAAFSGTLAITRGTGRYARARATSLRFTGTIERRNDSVSAHLVGKLTE
jgi:hypothetical protein